MKILFFAITIFHYSFSASQTLSLKKKVDSIVENINLRFDVLHKEKQSFDDSCSVNSNISFEDYYIDTVSKKLLKVIHANKNLKEIKTVFYFSDNRLIKIEVYREVKNQWTFLKVWYYDMKNKNTYPNGPDWYAINPADFFRYQRKYLSIYKKLMT